MALVVLVSGCRSGALTGTGSDWSASPGRLDLGGVYLGSRASAGLTLESATRAPLTLSLEVEAPFEAQAQLTLEGGQRLEVPVAFIPTEPGHRSTVARIFDGTKEALLFLEGEGLEIPTCASRDVCKTSSFDPSRGQCVEANAADGTACAHACLESGACFSGTCVGAQKRCEDENLCTFDSCDPVTGCVHTDVSAQCPASSDPCQVPFCDAASGCGLAPAADGTQCGPFDCTTSRVCMAGACETRPTPSGATCKPAGLCTAASTCQQNVCVPGGTTYLAERWRYAPTGKYLFFEGTVAPDGTSYFTESSLTDPNSPLELVALRKDGSEKFRVELERPCRYCGARLMLAPDAPRMGTAQPPGAVIAGRGGMVQARSMVDGALLWMRDTRVGKTLRSPKPDGGAQWSSSAFIALTPDIVVQQLTEGYDLHREYSVALDRASGAVLWERDWWGHVYFPGATEANELWVAGADCWAPLQQSQVLASNGATVGTIVRQARPITYLGNQALLSSNADYVWASAQGIGQPLPVAPWGYPWGLAAPERTLLASYDVVRMVGSDAGIQWSRGFPSYVFTGALLEGGGTLIAAQSGDGGSSLYSIGADGKDSFACPLPGIASSGAPSDGLWIAHLGRGMQEAIVAFEAPGAKLAPQGWVMPGGTANNDRRQR